MKHALALTLFAMPAWADTCPANPDHTQVERNLLRTLATAPDPLLAQSLNAKLWEIWLEAPDDAAQAMLDDGMKRRAEFDLLGARDVLGRLIAYCPGYAEGYNQRAFASFLAEDYEAALADLDRSLQITPHHIGALSGKALTLIRMGRQYEAQAVLRAAVALNPWLSERALLVEPEGEDI